MVNVGVESIEGSFEGARAGRAEMEVSTIIENAAGPVGWEAYVAVGAVTGTGDGNMAAVAGDCVGVVFVDHRR